jgi:hypothetical protein
MKVFGPLTLFAYVLGVVATDTPSPDIVCMAVQDRKETAKLT